MKKELKIVFFFLLLLLLLTFNFVNLSEGIFVFENTLLLILSLMITSVVLSEKLVSHSIV